MRSLAAGCWASRRFPAWTTRLDLTALRLALKSAGITPASFVPPASFGRRDVIDMQLARVLEGHQVAGREVGAPETWPDPLAFLDGVQRSEVVGYAGSSPIVVGTVSAAVRERCDRQMTTKIVRRRKVVIARPSALDAAGIALAGYERIELPDKEPAHPIRELAQAGAALDAARGQLEVDVGLAYRSEHPGWLVVDGSLTESPAWAADPRMLGVAKSHSTFPFSGDDLEAYLRLPPGHRSPLFEPASRRVAPVRSWALRLWPWEGKDLLHGLVRVEVAPVNGMTEMADRLSRWLLAERAPISAPDPGWDRKLYGMRSVEEFLSTTA